ncbi:putative Bet v I/Major latex protein [Helianthus annuus]|nr:putative Bet v I/Major latex protein [Helianthus annuus]KAJ0775524.1 putative Bet v I/Major latex protein [Helianthus annuus]
MRLGNIFVMDAKNIVINLFVILFFSDNKLINTDIPFTSGKFKQDVIDASNFIYNYTFFEGDNLMGILDSINHHVKIVPSAEGGCVFKQTVIYNCKGDEKPPVDVLTFEKELYEKTYKAIEAYAAAHPEVYN